MANRLDVRAPSARPASCPVCGYRLLNWIPDLLWGALSLTLDKPAPRWPKRRRATLRCAECGYFPALTATWLFRHEMEVG